MRLLICGDRDWIDKAMVFNAMATLPAGTVIIHGAARGADSIAESAARSLGLTVLAFPAEWRVYGRAAGPQRNQQMLTVGKPDEVWAFHDRLEVSRGTKDMVRRANGASVPVRLFRHIGAQYPTNWFPTSIG